jgi:hypothetical protein
MSEGRAEMLGGLVVAVLAAALAGCSPGTSPAAAAEIVALQNGEGPAGTRLCSESGDMASSSAERQLWSVAQQGGAIAAHVSGFAATTGQCAVIFGQSIALESPEKSLVNYVYQYRDASTAARQWKVVAYGGNAPQPGPGLKLGTATGLGPNSSDLDGTVGSDNFRTQAWQNNSFVVVVRAVNISAPDVRSEDTRIQSRIH